MKLRLELTLEIDTSTRQAVVVNHELANERFLEGRRCPRPGCGKLLRPKYQHCSISCKNYVLGQRYLGEQRRGSGGGQEVINGSETSPHAS